MIISSFIIQANVIMIINYDRKTFIVQATGENVIRNLQSKFTNVHNSLEGLSLAGLD